MSSWEQLPSLEKAHFPGAAAWRGDTCPNPSQIPASPCQTMARREVPFHEKFWIKFCLNSVFKDASRSSPEGPHSHSDQCPVAVPIQKHNKVHYYPCSMLKPAAFTALVSLRSSFWEMPVLIRTASLHRHSFTVSISQVKNLEYKPWIKCLVILGLGSKYACLSRPWPYLSAKCFHPSWREPYELQTASDMMFCF